MEKMIGGAIVGIVLVIGLAYALGLINLNPNEPNKPIECITSPCTLVTVEVRASRGFWADPNLDSVTLYGANYKPQAIAPMSVHPYGIDLRAKVTFDGVTELWTEKCSLGAEGGSCKPLTASKWYKQSEFGSHNVYVELFDAGASQASWGDWENCGINVGADAVSVVSSAQGKCIKG